MTLAENPLFQYSIIDKLAKSPFGSGFVIPAKAGIQCFQLVKNSLDSGFHRSDDFLRIHHHSNLPESRNLQRHF
jgi:hypothetical protein